MARIFSYSGRHAKILLEFTDNAGFLASLSVSKTHFTDKPAFSSDLSVKPRSKRLNFYGQTAVFAHFVRNRHFSSRTFTDRRPIFIDVSVILPNAAPDKSARQTLSQIYRQTILGYFHHGRRLSCIHKKPDQICNQLQIIRFFNLRQSFFLPVCFA